MRSLTFEIPGLVGTLVTVTELDGDLQFTLTQTSESGAAGDLRGLFFDLGINDSTFLSGLSFTGDDLTGSAVAGVTNLGEGVNVNGEVVKELGDFDAGVRFGTAGIASDDIRTTSFVLSHETEDLTLDLIARQNFAVRLTSVGAEGGDRTDSLKLAAQSTAAPDAIDDQLTASEDGTTTLSVLANDTDADGDPLIITGVDTSATTGTITNNGSNIVYDPGSHFQHLSEGEQAIDSFAYTISDGNGGTDTATATVTVIGVNDAPFAQAQSIATDEDTAVADTLVAKDVDDGAALTFALVDPAANGTAVVNADGSFTYTPNADFNGIDSFTYKNHDGGIESNTATVTIAVSPVIDAPVVDAGADRTADEGEPVTLAASFIDTDLPDTHTAQIDWGDGTTSAGTVANGGVSGEHVYVDDGAYMVSVTVTDSAGASSTDTVAVTINNVAPVVDAGPDASIDEGGTFELSASYTDAGAADTHVAEVDWDGDGMFDETVAASGGAVGGAHSYTAPGIYNVAVSVTDDDGAVHTDTLALTVVAVNTAPAAADDSYSTNEDEALTIAAPGVLANDSDVDGDPLTAAVLSQPSNGAVTLNADGSFTYTPNADFVGSDSFTYAAGDGTAQGPASVAITVDPVNDAPVAGDDLILVSSLAAPIDSDVLANDVDVDAGDTLGIQTFDTTASGGATITQTLDGTLRYDPSTGPGTGGGRFSYTIGDGEGETDTATVAVETIDGIQVRTNGNDIFFFQGTVTDVSATLVNPYSGDRVSISGEYNLQQEGMDGRIGSDTLFMTNLADAVFVETADGVQIVNNLEILFAGDGADLLMLASNNFTLGNTHLDGGAGDDILWANAGNDRILGREGNDIIDGGPGDDILYGGAGSTVIQSGNDRISGGAGDDILRGEDGDDVLSGGAGDDLFIFGSLSGHDIIEDFTPGMGTDDRLELVFTTFAQIQAAAAQDGANTVISFTAADTLMLVDVNVNDLHPDDFVLA